MSVNISQIVSVYGLCAVLSFDYYFTWAHLLDNPHVSVELFPYNKVVLLNLTPSVSIAYLLSKLGDYVVKEVRHAYNILILLESPQLLHDVSRAVLFLGGWLNFRVAITTKILGCPIQSCAKNILPIVVYVTV